MAYRATVVGASGYAGAELLRLLAGHPEIEVVSASAGTSAGMAVSALYPSLAPAYPSLEYSVFDPGAVDGLDLVFLALPHGESQALVPGLLDRVSHIVDLAADFRLSAKRYEEWYGAAHRAPELLSVFAYGLPELFRSDLAPESHIAAPGCYPTAAALALAPLLASGVVEPTGIIIDAMSGTSGAGRKPTPEQLFAEVNDDVVAYGLLTHRHTGEIEHALERVHGRPVQVLFTPHLVPMARGILATCHARPAGADLTSERLLDLYREHYAAEPFVIVHERSPRTKSTYGSNACHVTVRFDARTGSVLALAAIDNLVKGAAGQAIQALNRVLGLPEPTGLPVLGIMP